MSVTTSSCGEQNQCQSLNPAVGIYKRCWHDLDITRLFRSLCIHIMNIWPFTSARAHVVHNGLFTPVYIHITHIALIWPVYVHARRARVQFGPVWQDVVWDDVYDGRLRAGVGVDLGVAGGGGGPLPLAAPLLLLLVLPPLLEAGGGDGGAGRAHVAPVQLAAVEPQSVRRGLGAAGVPALQQRHLILGVERQPRVFRDPLVACGGEIWNDKVTSLIFIYYCCC